MKKKLSKIMGIGFALVLVASLMLMAIPAAAGLYGPLSPTLPNTWQGFPPTPHVTGAWFFDFDINKVGPLARSSDYSVIYAYVQDATGVAYHDIAKSTDGGRTWTFAPMTIPTRYAGGQVVDMVVSPQNEDILYVTDGNYVYKSVDGATTFMIIAEDSLELALYGVCGPTTVINWLPITCLDMSYNSNGDSLVFIGVDETFDSGGSVPNHTGPASVLYINEAGYPSTWTDLSLHCFRNDAPGTPNGGYIPYSVGAAPDFATSKKIYVVVSVADDICASCPDYDSGTDPRTFIVSNVGIACSWDWVDELFFDCDAVTPNNFQIIHASRFAFPSTYAALPSMFVGVTAWDGSSSTNVDGGDVYVAYDFPPFVQDALDLNVQGYTSACIGFYNANICSLDISASDELLAGAYDSYELQTPTRVYYSADTGWTWSPSLKDPTGSGMTYVLFGSAFAATEGYDCAFSMSCGDVTGQYWNQISLISMSVDQVLDLSHSPGYALDSSTLYVLTYDDNVYSTVDIVSLLRWDGTYWERVFSSRSFSALTQAWVLAPLYDWVEVSPDFNTTGCVYMANTLFEMTRTVDQGCSWRPLSFPCSPRPYISAWIVVDEETVLAAGGSVNSGFIWKTDRHGTRPWTPIMVLDSPTGLLTSGQGVDFDLSPSIATDSSVLFSNDVGEVYLSTDVGATWAELTDLPPAFANFGGEHNTYCVFDPGYGTAGDPGETMVYAAGGSLVGRQAVGSSDWVYISTTGASCDPFDMRLASGIDAAGDTALYVCDYGQSAGEEGEYILHGAIDIMYYYEVTPGDNNPLPTTCTIDVDFTGPPSGWAMDFDWLSGTFVTDEVLLIVSDTLECETHPYGTQIVGDIVLQGFVSGAKGVLHIHELVYPDCEDCLVGAAVIVASGVIYMDSIPPTPTAAGPTGVWRTLNPMDEMPPEYPLPKVEWEFLELGSPQGLIHPEAGLAGGMSVYPDDLWLTQASNLLWVLDSYDPSPTWGLFLDTIWLWDDPLAAPVIQVQPADGTLLATTTTATIEWQPLDLALLYEVMMFSFCETCPDNLAFFSDFTTDLTCYVVEDLTPGTTYFWKVRVACDHPFVSKWSDLRSFKTALGAVPYLCSPWCGQSDVILTTNFSWDAVLGATGYEVQVATDEAFTNIVASGSPTSNAWAPADPLEYSTTYYWRVRSVKDGIYSAWAVCIFTTEAAPVEPPAPPPAVVVEQTEVTPTWIWVIIGIGGALTIAVVILIVTTRKVP